MVKMIKSMKKILFFAAVAAIAASCVNENYDAEKVVLKASIEETKTTLVDGVKTHWTAGDQLSVFNSERGNCPFSTNISAPSKTAEFTFPWGDENFLKPEVYHAFYPYNKEIKTKDFATFTDLMIPAIQTPVENGFDPAAALCYGTGQSANVTFQNLTALIKFTVAADEVYNVKVVGTGANLAGAATFDGTTLVATEAAAQLKGVMRKGKTFYLAVAPGAYDGLNVFVNGLPVNDLNRTNKTLEAGKIYDMGALTNPRSSVVTYYTLTNIESQITKDDIKDGLGTTTYWDYSSTQQFVKDCQTWNTTGDRAYGYKIYHVAEDGFTLTSGSETVIFKAEANCSTTNGQMYAVPYAQTAYPLFFNIDWETKYNGQDNVYALVDQQERNGTYNSFYLSKSYYDAHAKKFVFDVAFNEYGQIKRIYGQLAK